MPHKDNRSQLRFKREENGNYLSSFSYFGSRIHDKINEFNKKAFRDNSGMFSYLRKETDRNEFIMADKELKAPNSQYLLNQSIKPQLYGHLGFNSEENNQAFDDRRPKPLASFEPNGSSVLMGDASMFTPQSVVLPKI